MVNNTSNQIYKRSEPTVLPDYVKFAKTCQNGLSEIYPFKSNSIDDPEGWKFGSCPPPSYFAFGRMRALLALQDALSLSPYRVLEVAAGGAGLASALADTNREVIVNDLRAEEIQSAINEYSTKNLMQIFAGNLFDLSTDRIGKFDLVIACEVIEHIAHPVDFLKHLKQFLLPQGRILLTTPNGLYFHNKLPTYSEINNFDELESLQFNPDADGHLFC